MIKFFQNDGDGAVMNFFQNVWWWTFDEVENALDEFFKCPSCGGVLNLKKNEKSQKAFAKQIDKIKKEMQN